MAYDPTDWSTADSTAYDTAQYFFTDADGAHVTEIANTPDLGRNVLIDSSGMHVRYATHDLAEFGSTVKLLDSTRERSLTMTGTGFTVVDETNTMLGFTLECYPGSVTNMAAVGNVVITGQDAGFNGNNDVEVCAIAGDATIRSVSGDVIVRTVNFTVQDSAGTQLWSGTAQQLADALTGGASTAALPGRVYAGSTVLTVGAARTITVFSNADFASNFNVSDSSNNNKCFVSFSNGDYGANAHHVISTQYGSSSGWSMYLDANASAGSFRVNYLVVVPTAYSSV